MTKSNKKIKNIIKSDVRSKTVSQYFGDYFNFYTRQNCPMTMAGLDRLAEDMVLWAKNPRSIKFNQFLVEKGMVHEEFSRFLEKSDVLQKCYTAVLRMIGNNRELAAADFVMDRATMHKVLHKYDSDWKDAELWFASLKTHDIADGAMPLYIKEMFYCGNCVCANCNERKEIFRKKE